MPYYTMYGNLTDIPSMGRYLNTVTGDMFGPAVLLIFFLILFFTIKGRTASSEAITGAGFVTFIMAVGFFAMSWIEAWMPSTIAMITIISALLSKVKIR